MSIRLLLGSLMLATSLGTYALNTEKLPESALLSLGATLAHSAGSSQWQQLWQRTRTAGHLSPGEIAHFTLPQPQVAELVKSTLRQADSADAAKTTQVRYRRDFQPQVVGMLSGTPLSAICLWVDWRTLPDLHSTAMAPHMGQVSLLVSRPCP